MKSKAKAATVAEKARMARLKEMPCIACAQNGIGQRQPTEVHHLLSGNVRCGHMFTVPLCNWHHQGCSDPFTPKHMRELYGPSLARSSKSFHAVFGTDDELLARTNQLLENHDARRT